MSIVAKQIPLALPLRRVPRGTPRRIGWRQIALGRMAARLNRLLGPREQQAFGILMYHRVTEPVEGFPPPTWNVPPRALAKQKIHLTLAAVNWMGMVSPPTSSQTFMSVAL
jgi:hypothetical protein